MAAASRANRNLVLALLCVASFAVVFNNLIIAPLLPEIADDLGVRVSVAGLLVAVYAVFGGVAAVFSGPFIDRLGRKPIVVGGMAVLTLATLLSAFAPSFAFMMAARALAGLGIACLTPAVWAAVGDYFDYDERGRAMGWVIAANSSAGILGVPAGALLAGILSWRWTFVVLAIVCGVFVLLLQRRLPPDQATGEVSKEGMGAVGAVLRDRITAIALLSNSLSTMYWFVFITYMGAYYHDRFGLALWTLGILTSIQGVGVLIGSNIGGRLGDRIGKRPVIIWSGPFAALFILLETTASPTWAVATVFLLLFAMFGAARFASAQAVMTEIMPARRGTVMALSASGQQLGIVAGAGIGAIVLDVFGYSALGIVSAAICVISTVLFWLYVPERYEAPASPSLRAAPSAAD